MYLLASLKDSSGLGGAYETKRRGEEENPVHGRNTTVNVDKIRGFRPPYVWMKTFVFFYTTDHRCTDRCFLYACSEPRQGLATGLEHGDGLKLGFQALAPEKVRLADNDGLMPRDESEGVFPEKVPFRERFL